MQTFDQMGERAAESEIESVRYAKVQQTLCRPGWKTSDALSRS